MSNGHKSIDQIGRKIKRVRPIVHFSQISHGDVQTRLLDVIKRRTMEIGNVVVHNDGVSQIFKIKMLHLYRQQPLPVWKLLYRHPFLRVLA